MSKKIDDQAKEQTLDMGGKKAAEHGPPPAVPSADRMLIVAFQ